MDRDDSTPGHFLALSSYRAMLGDNEYASIRLVSEGRVTSDGTPDVEQDRVAHSNHAKSGVVSEQKDLGFIASPSGMRALQLGDIKAQQATISKRANSTVTGIGVIAGGVLIALLAVLLLGILPCYLKRRRSRRQKSKVIESKVIDTENGTITKASHETYNSEATFAKPLSVVNEESSRSVLSLSLASSETAVHTVETEERRSPPPSARPLGTTYIPSSPSPSLRRPGDRPGVTPVVALPPRLHLRPDSAHSDRGRGQLRVIAPPAAPMRSRSVRFAERNSRQTSTPASAKSLLPNPWGESPPPSQLPGSSFEQRVGLFQLPPSERPPRRARSLKAAGLPRSPRDLPVSMRAETRSPSIPDSVSEYTSSIGESRLRVGRLMLSDEV